MLHQYKHVVSPKAMKFFNEAIKADPKNIGNYLKISSILQDSNAKDAAEGILEQALETNPKNPDLIAQMGLLQADAKHAIKYFDAALKIDPDNFMAHKYKISTFLSAGANVQAAKQYAEFTKGCNDLETHKSLYEDIKSTRIVSIVEKTISKLGRVIN
ncbi:MAG: hypothetical protein LN588_05740 [Rickettsia endosymbiont of Bryobia graminum]|nr:hypothetical protein [Rickettsia endosymbiont of Bryobia graminum]